MEQMTNKRRHDKHYDMTDYFNYGFNEYTLQIYGHKITKMSIQHNDRNREKYIERLRYPSKPLEILFDIASIAKRQ